MKIAVSYGLLLALAALLSACGGLDIKPTNPKMPKPLVVNFPADVGICYDEEFRKYTHEEERWGSKWQAALGESHVKMMNDLMAMTFHSVAEVPDPRQQPASSALSIVFVPHIDQYSFITPRDSGGGFFAVTIKYHFDVLTPDGRLADTLTLTGYGGAPATGFSGSKAMILATQAAMRDAAAKFLVQFPAQRLALKMRAGEPLIDDKPAAVASAQGGAEPEIKIEPVPIFPPSTDQL